MTWKTAKAVGRPDPAATASAAAVALPATTTSAGRGVTDVTMQQESESGSVALREVLTQEKQEGDNFGFKSLQCW